MEGRAQQTESALVETAQMPCASHQMAASSLAPPPAAIAAQPEGVETWHMPHGDPNQIEVPDLSLSDVVSEEEDLGRSEL